MIPKPHLHNFETLGRAFDDGNVCLIECHEQVNENPAYVICAVNREDGNYDLVPIARLFEDNPYELLVPPAWLDDQPDCAQGGRP